LAPMPCLVRLGGCRALLIAAIGLYSRGRTGGAAEGAAAANACLDMIGVKNRLGLYPR